MTGDGTRITAGHLVRAACVYVRQSTPGQVRNNLESKRLQYALQTRAKELGWHTVETIDEDLGRSGGGGVERPGFQKLLTAVCESRIGIVLSVDASRLARNGREWHTLLEFCAVVGCLLGDGNSIYDPALPDDRLLLGLLCGAPHNIPYVVQPAMSGSMRNPLSSRVFSRSCLT